MTTILAIKIIIGFLALTFGYSYLSWLVNAKEGDSYFKRG